VTEINSFISASNLTYTTVLDDTSTVTMDVSINDGGNTGSGGPLSSPVSNVDLTVNAVNDQPTVTAPASIGVTEDVASAITGISFADVDAAAGSVVATFTVAQGTLAATSGGGVTVGGSATNHGRWQCDQPHAHWLGRQYQRLYQRIEPHLHHGTE
jgi:hypothetical protein